MRTCKLLIFPRLKAAVQKYKPNVRLSRKVKTFLLYSLDFSDRKANTEITKEKGSTNSDKNDLGKLFNKHFVEYVLSVRDEAEKPAESILPFNEWKQEEMTKYGIYVSCFINDIYKVKF